MCYIRHLLVASFHILLWHKLRKTLVKANGFSLNRLLMCEDSNAV